MDFNSIGKWGWKTEDGMITYKTQEANTGEKQALAAYILNGRRRNLTVFITYGVHVLLPLSFRFL